MSDVLGSLLEGFDEGHHPRGYHGRWIAGGALDVFHGSSRIGSVSPRQEAGQAWFHPTVTSSGSLRRRASMDYAVASIVSHHQGNREGFPYAHHVEVAKAIKGSAKPVVRASAGRAQQARHERERYSRTVGLRQRGPWARRMATMALSSPAGILGALVESFAPPETAAQSMAIGDRQQAAARQAIASGRWNSAKHPRGGHGRFGYTTGGKRAKKGRGKSGQVTQGNTLTIGTTGALVKSVQRQLGIAQDGAYGQQTRAAVLRFQAQHGLKQDGVVGRQTLAALRGQQGAARIAPGPIGTKQARVLAPRQTKAKPPAKAPVRAPGGGVFAG